MTGPRWLVLMAALIAVAVVAVMLWPPVTEPDAPPGALPVPPRGGVIAAFSADRHPVWVIGHQDGAISVLDAFSSHVPFGINKPTWWCPRSRVIDDPFHGSRYDEFGERIAGPAPTGLGAYAFDVEAGRLVIDDAPQMGAIAQSGDTSEAADSCTAAEALVHDYTTLPEAETPAAAEGSDDGWLRLHATLVPVPENNSGLLCPARITDDLCAEVDIPGMDHLLSTPQDRAALSIDAWTDTDWLVHVVDGRIVEVSLLLESVD